MYPVDDKPDIYVLAVEDSVGICRARAGWYWTMQYYGETKPPFRNHPETHVTSLNYDAMAGVIYYMARTGDTVPRLYRSRVNDSERSVIFDQERLSPLGWPFTYVLILETAYDWATKNMYFNFNQFVGVINVDQPSWNMTFTLVKRKDVSSLALHPNRGYMYFVDVTHGNAFRSIFRANLDGSDVQELTDTKTSYQHDLTNLVVDFYEDKLYWSVSDTDTILYSDLDGQRVKTVSGVRVHYDVINSASRLMAVDRSFVYYRSADKNAIRRVVKGSYLEDPDFELVNKHTGVIREIMVFTYGTQKVKVDHPCKYNNGGCQRFCFAVPDKQALKRVCKCGFLEHVEEDGKSCAPGMKISK